jgi:hypothetical protein
MPKRDHLDKQGRHMGAMPPMEPHEDVEVQTVVGGWREVTIWVKEEGVELSGPQIRWLINELGSAWSRVYGEQK